MAMFQTVEKPRRRLMRQSSGGCVRGGQKAHRAFNQQDFETFMKVSKSAQRGEKTFSTRTAPPAGAVLFCQCYPYLQYKNYPYNCASCAFPCAFKHATMANKEEKPWN